MAEQEREAGRERIDLNDKAACERWVEMHLKGVRSTSNDERVEKALGSTKGEGRAG